jgi:ferredoxin
MRAAVADLLASERVKMAIGYRATSSPGKAVPTMVTTPGQAADLDWGAGCRVNLAAYLPAAVKKAGRVAVGQAVRRTRRCRSHPGEPGPRRGRVPGALRRCRMKEDAPQAHQRDGQPQSLCDIVIGAEGARSVERRAQPVDGPHGDPRDAQVAYLESLPAEERWQYWQRQFARCLRCYACRAACPLCYCESCIVEKHRPQWIPPAIESRANTAWNVVRALHLTGRCTGCDECARACPPTSARPDQPRCGRWRGNFAWERRTAPVLPTSGWTNLGGAWRDPGHE